MGYTHYWTQTRSFRASADWEVICKDVGAILTFAQHECGIELANAMGEGGTRPIITDKEIMFNGLGEDSHETMSINRVVPKEKYVGDKNPEWDFCKTARKPYDPVVTAVLCYMSTATRKAAPSGDPIIGSEAFTVSSDGDGSDFLEGLELARQALPQLANVLDLPMDLMRDDRWCAPWINLIGDSTGCARNKNYEVRFCIDGHGYVLRPKTGESYRFDTHAALAQWLDRSKVATFQKGGSTGWGAYPAIEENIWNAYGSFDAPRHRRLAAAQKKRLIELFPVPAANAHQPPAYVRPGEMPENAGREFCYSVAELLNSLKVA